MGKSKRNSRKNRRNKSKLESVDVGCGDKIIGIAFEKQQDPERLKEVSRKVKENPEPRILEPDEQILKEAMDEAKKDLRQAKEMERPSTTEYKGRKHVELTENLSPILEAGDILVKVGDHYIKKTESKKIVTTNDKRKGILGWLGYTEKAEHPNHFHASHVEAMPDLFKQISNG